VRFVFRNYHIFIYLIVVVVVVIDREALKGQSTKRLAQRGLCLTRLRFQYTYTGLYGRTILVFEGESLSRAQTFGPGFCLFTKIDFQ